MLKSARRRYFSTAIGTKVVVGATGLLLVLYLLLHLAGNLLLYLGPESFNNYSHLLIKNPLVVPVEIGLAATFVLHIYKAITNYISNRRARPVQYYQPVRRFFGWGWAGSNSRKSLASTTMIFTGLIVFVFLLIHLKQFKYGPEYAVAKAVPTGAAPEEIRDLYRLETEVFGNRFNVLFYGFCMLVVGAHVWHGFSSAFSSLGIEHRRYTPWLRTAGRVLAVVFAAGFSSIPIWVYFFGGRP